MSTTRRRPGAFEPDRQSRPLVGDTSYKEESFFVHEAYFTGAGQPYGSLRKALRADIDGAAWSTLYTTESRPFPPPERPAGSP